MKLKQFYTSRAWKYFRMYMLLKYSRNGIVQCSTSGRYYTLPDKRIHLGHYIKVFDGNSTNFATAFDERNVLPQGYQDNVYSSGKPDVMRKKLIEIHGEKEIEKLEIRSKNFCRLGKVELDVIAEEYKQKFKELVKIKGNPFK